MITGLIVEFENNVGDLEIDNIINALSDMTGVKNVDCRLTKTEVYNDIEFCSSEQTSADRCSN